jgi:glycerol-3-phosphate acyltransferase PlsY
MTAILVLLADYLIGAIPFGYLLVKIASGHDVRSMGSGNIGATNVLRTTGRAAAILTLILDIAKGWFALWFTARMLGPSPQWLSLACLAVMAGHAFPVFLKFHGGKAVATFVGAFFYLTPLPLCAVALLFFVVVGVTRHISAGSVIAAGLFPLAVYLIDHPAYEVLIASTVAGFFIVYRHHANIQRIRAGSENVFSLRGSRRA